MSIAPMTVTKKTWLTEEYEVSRKPLRREGRIVSAWTCGQRALRAIFCARMLIPLDAAHHSGMISPSIPI
ncbi:hypothetical protein [Bradyrhizobium sp. ARR65]|uniref:hypothetical protein n=1 Tax=Bradyrhizobium sp. ARR65 TaxID=1040989 RepID=UPI000ACC2A0D|nr:hypothetical protein [Bradyrhizobium sp. ARR65]